MAVTWRLTAASAEKKIIGNCLKAMATNFHPECFACAYCNKIFANSPFYLEDGLPYCEEDWNELSTTTTTPSASTARFARKTWKVKASLSNLESLSARPTPEDEQKFFQTSSKTFS